MKAILLLLMSCFICCGQLPQQRTAMQIQKSTTVRSTVEVLKDDLTAVNSTYGVVGISPAYGRYGYFSPSSSYTITKVTVSLRTQVQATPGREYVGKIMQLSPTTNVLATATNTIPDSSITFTYANYDFIFEGCPVTSGGTYYMVIFCNDALGSGGIRYSMYSSTGTSFGYSSTDHTSPNYVHVNTTQRPSLLIYGY